MNLTSPNGQEYVVGDLVGQTKTYRLRLCTQVKTGRQCLLQVAINAAYNGEVDRMAFILRELKEKAQQLEEEYVPHRKFPDERLNYDIGFPEVLESFIVSEQDGRRVNVLAFKEVDGPRRLVPLHNIVYKDLRRIDLRTSAWILGKTLKLLAFAHNQGTALGHLDLGSILIEPDEHYVILFDWGQARTHPEGVPKDQTRQEIMDATRAVITLLGGNRTNRTFPVDDVEGFEPYTQHLLSLAAGSQTDASTAHTEFYQLLRRNNWKGFHPFTFFPR